MRRDFEWSCARKKAYGSKKEAATAAARVRRETGSEVRAYHCEHDNHWHVGHPLGYWLNQQEGAA